MTSTELVHTGNESLCPWHHHIRQKWESTSKHELLRRGELAGSETRAFQETGNPDWGLDVHYPRKHLVDFDLVLLPIPVDKEHTHDPHAPSVERNLEFAKTEVQPQGQEKAEVRER